MEWTNSGDLRRWKLWGTMTVVKVVGEDDGGESCGGKMRKARPRWNRHVTRRDEELIRYIIKWRDQKMSGQFFTYQQCLAYTMGTYNSSTTKDQHILDETHDRMIPHEFPGKQTEWHQPTM
jgi:hypothetical protein